MRRSVREDPQSVADALFPVMGPAIRKAIVETVRGMLESTNRAIEASLSVQGLRWRIEAWRSGKSFAEIVLLHSLVYRVEQLLLIHKETGLLLRHVVASDAEAQDPDMVSGMLTAIRDFVRDSFGGKSGDSLDVFQVGELEVLVEDSPRAVLAAVVRGHPPPELRVELERALEAIEARFGTALDAFGGDTAPFEGAKDALESCLRARYDEKHPRGRGAVRMVWLAAAVIATLLIGWLVWWRADHRRWTRAIAALDAAPGLVVTGSEHRAGAVEIAGLRDPLAEEPLAILGRAGVDPERARLALEPYQSLEDEIVARRRSRGAAPRARRHRAPRRSDADPDAARHHRDPPRVAGLGARPGARRRARPRSRARRRRGGRDRGHRPHRSLGRRAAQRPALEPSRRPRARAADRARPAGRPGEHPRRGRPRLHRRPRSGERSAAQPARERAGAHRISAGRDRTLIAHKVCMLGSFAVGKTSLVRRFVETLFSDTYQTTVGVKVDKKVVDVHGQPVTLVLWDIQGVEEAEPLRRSYLRGAHGYLVVCDGTRGETLAQCLEIADKAKASIGDVPSLLLVNKADLKDQWEIPLEVLDGLRGKGWQILETSAKDGQNVEEAFQHLASSMVSLIKG